MNTPRLTHIAARGLLGQFDHDIDFPAVDEFVIVHGPNGVGKTRLLEAVDAVVKGKRSGYGTFKSMALTFDGSQVLTVEASSAATGEQSVTRSLTRHGVVVATDTGPVSQDEMRRALNAHVHSGRLRRMMGGPEEVYYRDLDTGELSDLESTFIRFVGAQGYLGDPESEIGSLLTSLRVSLIEVNRLRGTEPIRRSRLAGPDRDEPSMSATQTLAADLAARITGARAENSLASQRLDRTFPERLLEQYRLGDEPSVAELTEMAGTLSRRREQLEAASLLEAQSAPDRDPVGLEAWQRFALKMHYADALRKLDSFEQLAKQIELFRDIVGTKFLNKELVVDGSKGFFFRAGNGTELTSDQLSSGEQHEVVLTYRLIFDSSPGQLVLIDEPEISLHVAWQRQFLNDLQRIAQLGEMRFIVATHSPQIVGEWGDRVQLLGVVDA